MYKFSKRNLGCLSFPTILKKPRIPPACCRLITTYYLNIYWLLCLFLYIYCGYDKKKDFEEYIPCLTSYDNVLSFKEYTMRNTLLALALVTTAVVLSIRVHASWCDYTNSSYASSTSSHSYSYDFLELVIGQISLYDNKLVLKADVKAADNAFAGCARLGEPLDAWTTIKVSCKLSSHDEIIFKGKLSDDINKNAKLSMVRSTITKSSSMHDLTDYFENESSRISCRVYGNDETVRIKIKDRRD
jgi:hypothetical protein